jgi:hypothetical protein
MRYQVWNCKIVVAEDVDLPNSFDGPPRREAIRAVETAGFEVISCFSGWGGELTPSEKRIIDTYIKMRDHDKPSSRDC